MRGFVLFRQVNDVFGDYGDNVREWAGSIAEAHTGLHAAVAQFAVDGFALLPSTFQPWYLLIAKMYFDSSDRYQQEVFRLHDEDDGPTGETVTDPNRKMTNLFTDKYLCSLIVSPVTEAVGSLGFLDIPDLGVSRVSRDGVYFVSEAFRNMVEIMQMGLQGFHADGDAREAKEHGKEFALYTITAGLEGAVVDLYPGHMGGDPVKYGREEGRNDPIVPIRVMMQPGDTLVLSPGTRHRGTGYLVRNDRFFVSFKVGKSWAAHEGFTHDLQVVQDDSEKYSLQDLERWTWEMDLAWRTARANGTFYKL